jgi:hypothetical protein
MKGPNTKIQAPEKHQAPSFNGCLLKVSQRRCARVGFGSWNLELLWSLDLGVWSFSAVFAALLLLATGCHRKQTAPPTASRTTTESVGMSSRRDDAASRAAFLAAYPVFMHPRCLNCHPAGDVPLQGEDSHPHFQNVKRGPDGKGLYAVKCKNCHQDKNLPGENMPPGHPEWHLPPANMRMVFEGKSAAELARQLKDPKQNGGKTLDDIIYHVTYDSLVIESGWNPAQGKSKPPLNHAEFAKKMREWADKGAAVPE